MAKTWYEAFKELSLTRRAVESGAQLVNVFLTLSKAVFRSRRFALLFGVVSVPASIVTILFLTSSLIALQGAQLASSYHKSYLVMESRGSGPVRVGIVEVEATVGNRSVRTFLYILEDLEEYSKLGRLTFRGDVRSVGGHNVSVGRMLAGVLRVDVGSSMTLKTNTSSFNVNVVAVHSSSGFHSLVLLGEGLKVEGVSEYCAHLSRESIAEVVAERVENSLSDLLRLISTVSMGFYALIVLLSAYRLAGDVRAEVSILYGVGADPKAIRQSFVALCLVVSVLSSTFGVALGLFTVHFGVWAFRFFNVFFLARPTLELSDVLYVMSIAVASTIVAGHVASKNLEVE